MDATEQAAVERTLVDLASRYDGADLTGALDEFGWDNLLDSEGSHAVEALFVAQGQAGSWSAALHDLVAAGPSVADGALSGSTVVFPRPGASRPAAAEGAGLDGLLVGPRAGVDAVVAVTGPDDDQRLVKVARDQLSIQAVAGLDSRLPVWQVSAASGTGAVVAHGDPVERWWSAAVAAARRALCFELCGVMEAMLDLATAHARERYQFGRPVGSFQAVRHRLAESRVAASGARSAARASFDEHEPVIAAMAAKVVAGRAFGEVAAHCQQVLAGIGFTADHPFHRFLFRGVVADRLFGSAAELAGELGRALVARGDPVRLAEL